MNRIDHGQQPELIQQVCEAVRLLYQSVKERKIREYLTPNGGKNGEYERNKTQ